MITFCRSKTERNRSSLLFRAEAVPSMFQYAGDFAIKVTLGTISHCVDLVKVCSHFACDETLLFAMLSCPSGHEDERHHPFDEAMNCTRPRAENIAKRDA